jgi:hypothetical protein
MAGYRDRDLLHCASSLQLVPLGIVDLPDAIDGLVDQIAGSFAFVTVS